MTQDKTLKVFMHGKQTKCVCGKWSFFAFSKFMLLISTDRVTFTRQTQFFKLDILQVDGLMLQAVGWQCGVWWEVNAYIISHKIVIISILAQNEIYFPTVLTCFCWCNCNYCYNIFRHVWMKININIFERM